MSATFRIATVEDVDFFVSWVRRKHEFPFVGAIDVNDYLPYAIYIVETDKFLGWIGLYNLSIGESSSIGVFFPQELGGTRYIKGLFSNFIPYIFSEFNLKYIECIVSTENKRCLKCLDNYPSNIKGGRFELFSKTENFCVYRLYKEG